jgi:transcriptional accessory protein Tex/SPT6
VGLTIDSDAKVFLKISNLSAFEIKDPESYVETNTTVSNTALDVLVAEKLCLWYCVATGRFARKDHG